MMKGKLVLQSQAEFAVRETEYIWFEEEGKS